MGYSVLGLLGRELLLVGCHFRSFQKGGEVQEGVGYSGDGFRYSDV